MNNHSYFENTNSFINIKKIIIMYQKYNLIKIVSVYNAKNAIDNKKVCEKCNHFIMYYIILVKSRIMRRYVKRNF